MNNSLENFPIIFGIKAHSLCMQDRTIIEPIENNKLIKYTFVPRNSLNFGNDTLLKNIIYSIYFKIYEFYNKGFTLTNLTEETEQFKKRISFDAIMKVNEYFSKTDLESKKKIFQEKETQLRWLLIILMYHGFYPIKENITLNKLNQEYKEIRRSLFERNCVGCSDGLGLYNKYYSYGSISQENITKYIEKKKLPNTEIEREKVLNHLTKKYAKNFSIDVLTITENKYIKTAILLRNLFGSKIYFPITREELQEKLQILPDEPIQEDDIQIYLETLQIIKESYGIIPEFGKSLPWFYPIDLPKEEPYIFEYNKYFKKGKDIGGTPLAGNKILWTIKELYKLSAIWKYNVCILLDLSCDEASCIIEGPNGPGFRGGKKYIKSEKKAKNMKKSKRHGKKQKTWKKKQKIGKKSKTL
jgi:hypothetical protein